MKEDGSKALGKYGGVSGAVYDSQRLNQGERMGWKGETNYLARKIIRIVHGSLPDSTLEG